jgi:hypothetical protein
MDDDVFVRLRLTPERAYLAMYYFAQAYWERQHRSDYSVTLFVHSLGPEPEPGNPGVIRTADPASWADWKAAVRRALDDGYPKEL